MKSFLSIRIDREERQKLTASAKQLGFSRSALIRKTVDLYLRHAKPAA